MVQKDVTKTKSMINLDSETKILLNEIKSVLLNRNSAQPNMYEKTSYRAIAKMAIEQLHAKLLPKEPKEE